MSEKKSWDIRPAKRRAVRAAADPVLTRGKRPAARSAEPLKKRRRTARKRLYVLIGTFLIIVLGAAIWGLWQPFSRVRNVTAAGPHADATPALATAAMSGTYGWVIPRNSALFLPEEEVRVTILDAFPDIAAVSIVQHGLTGLSIETIPRMSAFVWCGSTFTTSAWVPVCYETDTEGFVFAPATATTSLSVYAPLIGANLEGVPLRAHVSEASFIPNALRFVRAMQSLGANVKALQLRDDEADLFLTGGTCITYILGHEEAAAQLAAASFSQLTLNDGSINYIDLRFDGKVYYKKKGE